MNSPAKPTPERDDLLRGQQGDPSCGHPEGRPAPASLPWSGRSPLRVLAPRLVFVAGALVLLGYTFRHSDFAKVKHLLASSPWLWVAPVPYLAVLCCDALGWKLLLGRAGKSTSFPCLFGIRLSAEAVGLSLPSGTVLSEAAALYLLRLRRVAPPGLAAASLAARRIYLAFGMGLMLSLCAVVGFRTARALSPHLIGGTELEWLAPAAALVLLATSVIAASATAGGAVGERVRRGLSALPLRRLKRSLESSRGIFAEADRSMARFFVAPAPVIAVNALLFAGIWFTEAVETYFFLSLLGAHLTFAQVLSFDSLLTLLRGLAFFVPAGLGIQDLGYLTVLPLLGVAQAHTVGAAFVLVKRSKELFWIAIGYLLLARHVWSSPRGGDERAFCPGGGVESA